MAQLIHMSEAATMAMHTMVLLAGQKENLVSTREISRAIGGSEAHLAKVLQRLVKSGLINSFRGPKGGFSLARSPETIPLKDVYEVIEGPLEDTRCLLKTPVCGGNCIMGGLLKQVSKQANAYLTENTLADFAGTIKGGNHGSK